jgi:hypothetical protein
MANLFQIEKLASIRFFASKPGYSLNGLLHALVGEPMPETIGMQEHLDTSFLGLLKKSTVFASFAE